jgi:hypothetical protein
VAANSVNLSDGAVNDLVGHLTSLLPHQRRTVLKVCKSLLSQVGSKLNSIASAVYACRPSFVNIAMTLQRFEDTRSEGMDLMEQLLRLGLDDAFSCLNEIDLRPATANCREPRAATSP